ncbi:MAG: glycosyl transferase family 28 [Flaviaesturariibacter sp.]|nr:glycosyl transferase family 28 [Flaviaesturariibacter sp.]
MNAVLPPLKPRILVAPLDWGLGHATRCIPLIRQLLQAGVDVVLAGEGKTAALLSSEFPQLLLLPLKGYRVKYGKTGLELMGKLLLQVPKVLDTMDEEQEWLKTALEAHQFDAVISDNRYGLYSDKVPSVLMTHQLLVKTGFSTWADRQLQKLHYGYFRAFTECWIPDAVGETSLAGELAHPAVLPPIPVQYIGPLSRFAYTKVGREKHLLVLLSGPEPQRTLLEESLLAQLNAYDGPTVLVRGLPGSEEQLSLSSNITVLNHLPAGQLEACISEASFVIARTGYSTVMDLMTLQKKSILIPTPGQTEQEYLAKHLMEQNFALCIQQPRFRLLPALALAASFPYQFPEKSQSNSLSTAVQNLLQSLPSKTV